MIASFFERLVIIEKAVVCVSQTNLYHTKDYKNAYWEFAKCLLLV